MPRAYNNLRGRDQQARIGRRTEKFEALQVHETPIWGPQVVDSVVAHLEDCKAREVHHARRKFRNLIIRHMQLPQLLQRGYSRSESMHLVGLEVQDTEAGESATHVGQL